MPTPNAIMTLLRQHVEAGWGVRLPPLAPGDHDTLSGGEGSTRSAAAASWQLYWAETDQGAVRLWRHGIPAERRAALLVRAVAAWEHATIESDPTVEAGVRREVALALPVDVGCDTAPAQGAARRITAEDGAMLEQFEPGESAYYLDRIRAPVIGVVVDGRLMTVAHSSRRTPEACELGVETLPDARHQGYARVATVLWTASVRAEHLVPLYSAAAANAASLALARATGYRPFARAVYLTV